MLRAHAADTVEPSSNVKVAPQSVPKFRPLNASAVVDVTSSTMYEYYSASTRQKIGAKRAFDAREQNKNEA